jgi:hypothetical protein
MQAASNQALTEGTAADREQNRRPVRHQAAMVYEILRDKERLDAGEPTEIVARHTRVDIAGVDKLAVALGQTLPQSGNEIDVTPADSGTMKN